VEIALPDLAEAQHKAVRALAYGLHISPYVIAENLPGKVVPLSFDQQKQFALEALRFSDGSTWKEISAGKGKVFWSSWQRDSIPRWLCTGTFSRPSRSSPFRPAIAASVQRSHLLHGIAGFCPLYPGIGERRGHAG
jgi:hypothetical protein